MQGATGELKKYIKMQTTAVFRVKFQCVQLLVWKEGAFYRVLKGGVQGEGVFLGNPEDSVWEDWGTLGKIWVITTPGPLRILLSFHDFQAMS